MQGPTGPVQVGWTWVGGGLGEEGARFRAVTMTERWEGGVGGALCLFSGLALARCRALLSSGVAGLVFAGGKADSLTGRCILIIV